MRRGRQAGTYATAEAVCIVLSLALVCLRMHMYVSGRVWVEQGVHMYVCVYSGFLARVGILLEVQLVSSCMQRRDVSVLSVLSGFCGGCCLTAYGLSSHVTVRVRVRDLVCGCGQDVIRNDRV